MNKVKLVPHRRNFEFTRLAGRPTAGVTKDVAMVGGDQEQLHMDFGFMTLFDYVATRS